MPRAAAITDRVMWNIELVSKVVFSLNGVKEVVPLVTGGLTGMVVSSFFVHYTVSMGMYFDSMDGGAMAVAVAWGRRNYMSAVKTVR